MRYVLAASLDLADLSGIFGQQRVPSDWTAAILDRQKRIIARSRTPQRFPGQRATSTLAWRSAEVSERSFWDVTKEGSPSFEVFSRSALSEWTVVLGVPASEVQAARRSLWLMVGSGITFLGLGIVLAVVVARRIARPIAALARSAEALESPSRRRECPPSRRWPGWGRPWPGRRRRAGRRRPRSA